MFPTSGRYEAAFYVADNDGKRHVDHYLPVEAWSDEGEPMVLDGKAGRLRRADTYGNFDSVAECRHLRPVAAVPGGGWLMRYTAEGGSTWTEPVVAWTVDEHGFAQALVSDGYGDVMPISATTDRPRFFHPDQHDEAPAALEESS